MTHFAVVFSLVGVDERRDASSRMSDNGNAMSRTADIRNASSRTLDNGEYLVPGGGREGIRQGGHLGPGGGQEGGASARAACNGGDLGPDGGRQTMGRPRTYILYTHT